MSDYLDFLAQMHVQPMITREETASLLQGIWPSVSCVICQKELGVREEGRLIIAQAECYTAEIPTVFVGGKLYLGVTADACSEEHADQFLATRKKPYRAEYAGATLPSQDTKHRTIYAVRQDDTYPQNTVRSGKWLLFPPNSEVDQTWPVIKQATEQGTLGGYSKVVYNPRKETSLICIYTSDYADKPDVSRVRQALRGLGFTRKLAYKADETTRKGIYQQSGQRVSLYYE